MSSPRNRSAYSSMLPEGMPALVPSLVVINNSLISFPFFLACMPVLYRHGSSQGIDIKGHGALSRRLSCARFASFQARGHVQNLDLVEAILTCHHADS